jgi:hypothetical protein
MVDQTSPSAEPEASVCPWCSARYTGEPDTCPSCGAALAVDPATDPALPGLTAIDAAAIVRAKTPVARPRSRLLSWISGEYPDDAVSPSEVGALAPPDADVRREMLRLALEAEVANLQAEADALMSEATVDGHASGAIAEETVAADAVVEDLERGSADLDDVDAAVQSDPMTDEDRQAAVDGPR